MEYFLSYVLLETHFAIPTETTPLHFGFKYLTRATALTHLQGSTILNNLELEEEELVGWIFESNITI
jgi:hypothetical protein